MSSAHTCTSRTLIVSGSVRVATMVWAPSPARAMAVSNPMPDVPPASDDGHLSRRVNVRFCSFLPVLPNGVLSDHEESALPEMCQANNMMLWYVELQGPPIFSIA